MKVEKGDSLYLFTDGFADQFGGDDEKKFKSKQMKEMIVEINKESMATQRRIFEETFEKWKGDQEQVDDVCVIGILID
jgi:serine phosphatase RsbU (regulator of sigma subunit)